MKTEYKKPNPDALDEVTKIISDLHTNVPSDEFINSIENSEESDTTYPLPKVAKPVTDSNPTL